MPCSMHAITVDRTYEVWSEDKDGKQTMVYPDLDLNYAKKRAAQLNEPALQWLPRYFVVEAILIRKEIA